MNLRFSSPDLTYDMIVPEWFYSNRGNGYKTFKDLRDGNGIVPEVETYKKMRMYMTNFPKDSVFLDVGANLGIVTIPIARMGYRVIAVEPSAENLFYLMKNLELNDVQSLVKVIPCIASDSYSMLNIYEADEGDCTSISQEAAAPHSKEVKAKQVYAVRLDSWVENNKVENIRFIKIDVQGAEFSVLKGLEHLLEKPGKKSVLIECDAKLLKFFAKTPEDINNFMVAKGFQPTQWGYEDILYTKE